MVVMLIGGEFGPLVLFLVALYALMGRAPPDLHRPVDFREDPSSRDGVGLTWADREGLDPLDDCLCIGEDGDTFHLMLLAALGSDLECADDCRALRGAGAGGGNIPLRNSHAFSSKVVAVVLLAARMGVRCAFLGLVNWRSVNMSLHVLESARNTFHIFLSLS